MGYLSESELRTFMRSDRFVNSLDSLNDYLNESRYSKTTIFLSHKHSEKDFLDGAISLLKRLNAEIYVDWLDDSMPEKTSGFTAENLKSKIVENDKFIFLATEGAINSKWCNWELGYGDAIHYDRKNIAIFPIRKDNNNYSGSEYLEIYPYIEYEYGNKYYEDNTLVVKGYYVKTKLKNGKTNLVSLKDWLK